MNGSDERLQEEQSRALQIHGPSGALLRADYLERRQEFVAVNRNDLADLKMFDTLELALMGAGSFFFSGAVWLGIDKYFENTPPMFTPIVFACILSALFGVVLTGAGIVMHVAKRRRIDRIFGETTPLTRV
jgi:hypothetical protein